MRPISIDMNAIFTQTFVKHIPTSQACSTSSGKIETALVYLNDIVILSKTTEEHITRIKQMRTLPTRSITLDTEIDRER